jgi:hypothetical protein
MKLMLSKTVRNVALQVVLDRHNKKLQSDALAIDSKTRLMRT